MKRLKDDFLKKIEKQVPLKSKDILEVGCGEGTRTQAISKLCRNVTAIDPDAALIKKAKELQINNARFAVGNANALSYENQAFDIVLFTLSLHHISPDKMDAAIKEACRVVRPDGRIIFFEPAFTGTFFEAELTFDACDGDERAQKAFAYYSMLVSRHIIEIAELPDETIFQFDSVEDFIASMKPKKDLGLIKMFLESHNFILSASRRINIFTPAKSPADKPKGTFVRALNKRPNTC